ncbi:hypothetical protein A3H86_00155 [Candidatus Roizmanbacteria bacterium RIFCSPLOWO2_02_FULL_41_9]|nr:MAG: hypothetical protein A3H86_00155 [Candidatus Roizmanbacteria bacterium RIFCSPLOWO2_02_FULL_41_9]
MTERTIPKEAHKKGLAIFDLLRRVNIDGSLAQDREWPPRTIIKSWHNEGSIAENNITKAVAMGVPIPLVGFWGVGDKTTPDNHDEGFLRQLQTLSTSVSQVYGPGMEFILLLADGHALFNGYSHAHEYLGQVGYLAGQLGILTRMLSDLYEEWGIVLPSAHDPIDTSSSALYGIWNREKYTRQKAQLIESAARHHRNGASSEQAAYWYYVMREQEKEPLSTAFSSALLFANTGPDLGGWLLPKHTMPILYMQTKPPWFQNGNH